MRTANRRAASPIGHRIHVMGNTGAGKSTLGTRLARTLDVPFVELDALNWEPNWVGLNATNPTELERRMRVATAGRGGSSLARTSHSRSRSSGRNSRP